MSRPNSEVGVGAGAGVAAGAAAWLVAGAALGFVAGLDVALGAAEGAGGAVVAFTEGAGPVPGGAGTTSTGSSALTGTTPLAVAAPGGAATDAAAPGGPTMPVCASLDGLSETGALAVGEGSPGRVASSTASAPTRIANAAAAAIWPLRPVDGLCTGAATVAAVEMDA